MNSLDKKKKMIKFCFFFNSQLGLPQPWLQIYNNKIPSKSGSKCEYFRSPFSEGPQGRIATI